MTLPDNKPPPPDVANTAAVIVSYFPDDGFAERMDELARQFAAVFWVDNTPQGNAPVPTLAGTKVHYMASGENAGLASALNEGCRAAIASGFLWAVTFDQDSLVAANFVARHLDAWRRYGKPAFILGCNYADSFDGQVPRFPAGAYVRECRTVITSGSLMCLPQWNELGGFRDELFIDGVDHELCLRARANGLLVARHGEFLMQHQIGEVSPGVSILSYRQPAVRMYYSTRNGVRNIIEFASSEPLWAVRRGGAIVWEGLVAVLLGPRRMATLRAVVSGLVDGVRGRMGPVTRKD